MVMLVQTPEIAALLRDAARAEGVALRDAIDVEDAVGMLSVRVRPSYWSRTSLGNRRSAHACDGLAQRRTIGGHDGGRRRRDPACWHRPRRARRMARVAVDARIRAHQAAGVAAPPRMPLAERSPPDGREATAPIAARSPGPRHRPRGTIRPHHAAGEHNARRTRCAREPGRRQPSVVQVEGRARRGRIAARHGVVRPCDPRRGSDAGARHAGRRTVRRQPAGGSRPTRPLLRRCAAHALQRHQGRHALRDRLPATVCSTTLRWPSSAGSPSSSPTNSNATEARLAA